MTIPLHVSRFESHFNPCMPVTDKTSDIFSNLFMNVPFHPLLERVVQIKLEVETF